MEPFKKSYYAGIFLIAASTLLFEISLTKIFSVIHYHYFAFFIVSTALFGYGLSGVYLLLSKFAARVSKNRMLFLSSVLFVITMVIAYKLILEIPLRLTEVLSGGMQLLYLAETYLLLGLPFFFSGLVIGVLLSSFPDHINRLYFADLTGAAVGCFSILLVIPEFGGSGAVLLSAGLACLAALMFSQKWQWSTVPVALILLFCILTPDAERYFSTIDKSEKRHFRDFVQRPGRHLYSGWSPASRIDVTRMSDSSLVIWIDGGTNQSFMRKLKPKQNFPWNKDQLVAKPDEIPYALLQKPRVLIIGPGGGVEVASALRYKPATVTGVELDPLIVELVLGEFSDYIGKVYQRTGVTLINEEGRSYIRRSNKKFDIIQQRNNAHPMAVASGALNLSETYLLTKEAFHEYLDHLSEGGFVSIARNGGSRLLNLGAEVFLERGIRDYWKRMVLIRLAERGEVFFLKNGDFNDEELNYVERYCTERGDSVAYSPRMYGKTDNILTRLMDPNRREEVIRDAPFQLEAPTDDKPFMEHFYRLGAFFFPEMKQRLNEPFWNGSGLVHIVTGTGYYPDLSLYMILLEAILLSTVFIIYPLLKMKRSGIAMKGARHLLVYYFSLGVGFIFIEIVLIQKYILFIGYPVYAVAAIIFSLLIAAGAGSLVSSRFASEPFRILRIVIPAIVILVLLQILVIPALFKQFISVSFGWRMALSILFIIPVGFVLGMPFPLGLSWTAKHFSSFVPWAWGVNGYATVIGSVLSVILALNFGFRVVLLIAAGIYVVGYWMLRTIPVPKFAEERISGEASEVRNLPNEQRTLPQ